MPLPVPNLDDKSFDQLVDEARKLIPLYAPSWTDHNLHDPGITFMELLAWLTEMELYCLNRITDRHLLKYLALLGDESRPAPAKPAKVDVQITSSDIKTIPAGTVLLPIGESSDVAFHIDKDIEVLPLELKKIISHANYQFADVTEFNKSNESYYYAFGEKPRQNDALYLGMGLRNDKADLSHKELGLGIYLCEKDLPPLGQHGDEKPSVYPSAKVVWEHWSNKDEWGALPTQPAKETFSFSVESKFQDDLKKGIISEDLRQKFEENQIPLSEQATISSEGMDGRWIITDKFKIYTVRKGEHRLNIYERTIIDLSESVHLVFWFPADIKKGVPLELPANLKITDQLFWIRCRVGQADYEIPPRIDRILLNVVSATQGQRKDKDKDEEFESTELPYQVFNTAKHPIVPDSQTVTIGTEWKAVNDLDASKPDDKHYVIDYSKGEIHFGDGINGAIPPKDAKIKVSYRYGAGEKGNIGPRKFSLDNPPGVTATSFRPACGGTEQEDIEEAFVRFRKDLRVAYTAVTAEDYEEIAMATPGLRVARAKALACSEDNSVTVVVVPFSLPFMPTPKPSEGFKRTVCEHLNKHRLITTYITVEEPDYVEVSVNAAITIRPGYSPEKLKDSVKIALNKFLSPIKRASDDNEWPFGRDVYRSEVYETIESVKGVDCVARLSLVGGEGNWSYRGGNIEIGDQSTVYAGTHFIEIIEPQTVCKRGANE